MPKITVHGGPSNADEEKACPGKASSASTTPEPTESGQSETLPPSPAPTTEPPSSKVTEESSTAFSTGSTTGRETGAGKGRSRRTGGSR